MMSYLAPLVSLEREGEHNRRRLLFGNLRLPLFSSQYSYMRSVWEKWYCRARGGDSRLNRLVLPLGAFHSICGVLYLCIYPNRDMVLYLLRAPINFYIDRRPSVIYKVDSDGAFNRYREYPPFNDWDIRKCMRLDFLCAPGAYLLNLGWDRMVLYDLPIKAPGEKEC